MAPENVKLTLSPKTWENPFHEQLNQISYPGNDKKKLPFNHHGIMP
jgi:hypothetical protein